MPKSTRLWKLLKSAEFRTPTAQDVRKKGSKILEVPSVRSCFALAMANEFVVIINSLRVPKIKKILLYEMKFLVPNYSCFQNPWLEGYHPQIPILSVLCPQLNLLNSPKQNSLVRHWSKSRFFSATFTFSYLQRLVIVHRVLKGVHEPRFICLSIRLDFPATSFHAFFEPRCGYCILRTFLNLLFRSIGLHFLNIHNMMIANHKTYLELIYNSSVVFLQLASSSI